MTKRTRALLEQAVADVTPRVADPSSDIVRRAVARRRRSAWVTAAIAAVAVVSVLTVVKLALPSDKAPAVSASPSQANPMPEIPPPLRPRVEGTGLHLNSLVLPLTNGWKYKRYEDPSAVDYCSIPPKTIAYTNGGVAPGDCDARPQVTFGQSRGLRPSGPPIGPAGGINEVVLPGGQPVWLDDNEVANFTIGSKTTFLAAAFNAPWARIGVYLEMPTTMDGSFLGGIRADVVPPARLSMPEAPTTVYVIVDGNLVSSTAPTTIREVIDRLKALDQVVDSSQPVCPGGPKVGPVWRLAGQHMAEVTFTAYDPVRRIDWVLGTVAVSTSPTCAFATSSLGGRVWLPAGFAAQLHELVGSGK
jgi:hypothetical protein